MRRATKQPRPFAEGGAGNECNPMMMTTGNAMTKIHKLPKRINTAVSAVSAAREHGPDFETVRRNTDWSGSKQKGICPVCHERKLSINRGRNKEVVVWCWGCSDGGQEAICTALGLSGSSYRTATTKRRRPSDTTPNYDEHGRHRNGLNVWRRACGFRGYRDLRPVSEPVEQPTAYFKSRGVANCPARAMLLPASEARKLANTREEQEGDPLFSKNAPVMCLPITTSDGRFTGVHTTSLNLHSSAKLNGDARRIFGIKKGGYIELNTPDPNEPLIVGEGVETTASAMEIAGDLPGVSAIDAGNFASVVLPPCAELIIARDRGRVGRKAATVLAQRYASQMPVRIAVPPKGYKDWNDAHRAALRGDLDIGKLKRAILRAPLYEIGPSDGFARTMEDIMQLEIAPRPCLLDPWVKARSSGQIHALRGAGKTRFAMSVAYALASGTAFLGWTVERPVRVLYIDAELDLAELKERLEALGPKAATLSVISFDDLYNQGVGLPDLGKAEGRQFFDREFELAQPDVVFLDSLTFLAKVAENEAEAWDPIAEWIVSWRRRGVTIIWVHHQGRSGKARGTSKREDSIEVSIALKPRDDIAGDGSAFELVFDKHRGFYGNDAAPRVVRFTSENGRIEWSCETKQENTKTRIAELLAGGYKQADIAKELNVTRGYVSQVVTKIKTLEE